MPLEINIDRKYFEDVRIFELSSSGISEVERQELSNFRFLLGIPGEYIIVAKKYDNEIEVLRVFFYEIAPIYLEKVIIKNGKTEYQKLSPFKNQKKLLNNEEFLKKILEMSNFDIS
jgi:hypothetical protein